MRRKINVLVAEDSAVLRMVALANLRKFPVAVVFANDGSEAVSKFREYDFDLVFMDIAMPGKDGIQATKEIRQIEQRTGRRVPIIAITASDTRDSCLQAGMDDFVSKPADYFRVFQKWCADLVQSETA